MSKFITAKTFPLDPLTGEFQSGPAELAYREAVFVVGSWVTRAKVRSIIQAYQCAQDECDRKYKKFREERQEAGCR